VTKISVCLASFNGDKYINSQIVSILAQLTLNDELIISDDHSTDNTIAVIKMINDGRIKLVFNKLPRGYSENFENAISYASGDIIFLSDQDDIWLEGKVEKMLCVLDNVELAVCNAKFVDQDLNTLNKTLFSLRGGKKGFLKNLYKSRYLGACIAFRREILVKLLPFPRNKKLCPHDLWISLIAEFYFRVGLLADELILYRRHGMNVSDGGIKNSINIYRMILFRTYSLLMVMSRMLK
jgi:glycosyltransferase involved in cell wall biosynthesis